MQSSDLAIPRNKGDRVNTDRSGSSALLSRLDLRWYAYAAYFSLPRERAPRFCKRERVSTIKIVLNRTEKRSGIDENHSPTNALSTATALFPFLLLRAQSTSRG